MSDPRSQYQSNDPRLQYQHFDPRSQYTISDPRSQYIANDQRNPNRNVQVQNISNAKLLPHRSPILSSEFIGIGNESWQMGSETWSMSSDQWKMGSEIIGMSSEKFTSSDDILHYLEKHPCFLKLPKSNLNAIVAAIISGLMIAGGVTLSILTAGSGGPVLAVVAAVCISTGVSGMTNAITGAISGEFRWLDWTKASAISAGLKYYTFFKIF